MDPSTKPPVTVFVTGGGSGIGCCAVGYLLKQYNARVVVLTLDVGSELQALQREFGESRLIIYQGDVTKVSLSRKIHRAPSILICSKVEDTFKAVGLANEKFDGLDAVIVSAGIEPPPTRIGDMSYETFQRTLNVNVCGAFLSVHTSLPLLLKSSRPARIVILSSTADKGKYAGRSAYCASKAALTRFIDSLQWEFHENANIRVFGVYPGFTQTPMAETMISGKYSHVLFPEEAARYREWIQAGAVEPPDWCADACARLAIGIAEGLPGQTASYSQHVPELRLGKW